MKKARRYTVISFLLAVLFVLGSMAGMDLILQREESRMLWESGILEMESPVGIWQEPGDRADETIDDEAGGETEKHDSKLTLEQIEEVVAHRANASVEIFHNPTEGQITMEEAIASGEDWLVEMDFVERTEESMETDFYAFVKRASLGTKKNQGMSEISMEPYYSFWTVQFSNQYMYAVLSINAVTGKVWDAEITLYDSGRYLFSWEKLKLFMQLAGIGEEAEEDYVLVDDTGTEGILSLKGSPLYARTKCYDLMTTVDTVEVGGVTDEEYHNSEEDGKVVTGHNENAQRQRVIIYRLRSAKS